MNSDLEKLLVDALPDEAAPGCAIALVTPDGTTTAARGLADLEHQVPITADTVFHVASVSKQFTAYAVALLARDGLLALDDAVATHLPWVPFPEITIEHLIRHTSGLRDQWQLLVAAGRRIEDVITTGDIVRLVRRQRGLNFPPGSAFSYSNTGYTLLGLVVEQVTGSTLQDFCREEIFAPLGMTSTRFVTDHQEVVARRAGSYGPAKGGGFHRIALAYSTAGATSLNTTVVDLARWARHTMTPAARALREIGSGEIGSGEIGSGSPRYALGVRVGPWRGHMAVQHAGADAGYRAHFLVLPDDGLAAVALANNAAGTPGDLCRAALAPWVDPEPAQRPAVAAQQLDAHAGTYLDRTLADVFTVTVADDGLRVDDGLDTFVLRPAGAGRFTGPDGIEVVFTADGATLHHDPVAGPTTWERLPTSPPASPPPPEAGLYYSDELEVAVRLVADADGLHLSRPHRADAPLRRLTGDTFVLRLGGDDETPHAVLQVTGDGFTYSTQGAQGIAFHRIS